MTATSSSELQEVLSVRRAWRLAVEACAYRWRHDLDPALLPASDEGER